MKHQILEKFLKYVVIDTQSNDASDTTPSTTKQFDLANILVEELKTIGIQDAEVDEHCYVYATIPGNTPAPTIGFLAHLDTSPDSPGTNVKPQVINNYQGGDIILPGDNNIIIKEDENPALKKCIGHTIVTSDGTTLLGSDDKSGIAAIMQMAELLMKSQDVKHGDIRICFTPDEEIGRGTKCINLDKLGCVYAYTLDGDMPGELNKETFSADGAVINITGRDIHPGNAKNIMINAGRVMGDILARLPKDMAPETTDGYQPFIHPYTCFANILNAQIKLLLRDFKTEGLSQQKDILQKIIAEVQILYPNAKIELQTFVQYRNMNDSLEKQTNGLDYL
jgi:tripeptide aminopeptidase